MLELKQPAKNFPETRSSSRQTSKHARNLLQAPSPEEQSSPNISHRTRNQQLIHTNHHILSPSHHHPPTLKSHEKHQEIKKPRPKPNQIPQQISRTPIPPRTQIDPKNQKITTWTRIDYLFVGWGYEGDLTLVLHGGRKVGRGWGGVGGGGVKKRGGGWVGRGARWWQGCGGLRREDPGKMRWFIRRIKNIIIFFPSFHV